MQVTVEVPHELTGDSRESAQNLQMQRLNTEVGRDSQESKERRKKRRGMTNVLSDRQLSIDRSSQPSNYNNYKA